MPRRVWFVFAVVVTGVRIGSGHCRYILEYVTFAAGDDNVDELTSRLWMEEKLVLEAHCQLEILGIFEAVGTFALWRLTFLFVEKAHP